LTPVVDDRQKDGVQYVAVENEEDNEEDGVKSATIVGWHHDVCRKFYKTFSVHDLRIIVISWSVCPWQAMLAKCNVCG
jgi:hypothetical protein